VVVVALDTVVVVAATVVVGRTVVVVAGLVVVVAGLVVVVVAALVVVVTAIVVTAAVGAAAVVGVVARVVGVAVVGAAVGAAVVTSTYGDPVVLGPPLVEGAPAPLATAGAVAAAAPVVSGAPINAATMPPRFCAPYAALIVMVVPVATGPVDGTTTTLSTVSICLTTTGAAAPADALGLRKPRMSMAPTAASVTAAVASVAAPATAAANAVRRSMVVCVPFSRPSRHVGSAEKVWCRLRPMSVGLRTALSQEVVNLPRCVIIPACAGDLCR
jgi:hypothetical protein